MDKEKAKSLLLDFVNLIPAFVKLMYNLVKDPAVSATDKAVLGAAIVYIFSPVDLIPDVIPFLGQVDDAYLVAIALQRLLNSAGPEIIKKYWEGSMDVFNSLQNAVEAALFFLPQKTVDILLKKIPN
ncbi:MAG: DUF1232 domain-containing protein [Peptococcaceae bacterium]|nr:DUF1232 domain-containing protein [Peptococcaceae bacterium]